MMEDFRTKMMQHQLTWLSDIVSKVSTKLFPEYLSFKSRIGLNSVIIEVFKQTLSIQPNSESIVCYHGVHVISGI